METKIEQKKDKYELVLRGTKEQVIAALETLYLDDLVECDHEFTEPVSVDDTHYFDTDGNLHGHSNPDTERCLVCGKIYNNNSEEWEWEKWQKNTYH